MEVHGYIAFCKAILVRWCGTRAFTLDAERDARPGRSLGLLPAYGRALPRCGPLLPGGLLKRNQGALARHSNGILAATRLHLLVPGPSLPAPSSALVDYSL